MQISYYGNLKLAKKLVAEGHEIHNLLLRPNKNLPNLIFCCKNLSSEGHRVSIKLAASQLLASRLSSKLVSGEAVKIIEFSIGFPLINEAYLCCCFIQATNYFLGSKEPVWEGEFGE